MRISSSTSSFPGLDPLGDLDFPLPGQELKLSHLFQIQADRVGGLAEVIDALFLGLFLGLGFGLRPGALAGNFVEDLDVHALEALQRRPEVAGRGYILWQKIIYLVEGEITLLSSEADETLQIFAFVFMLHPICETGRVSTRAGVAPCIRRRNECFI